jgi:hypothetical protein
VIVVEVMTRAFAETFPQETLYLLRISAGGPEDDALEPADGWMFRLPTAA